MKKLQKQRIDISNITIHNKSNKLPGHEERMKAHCERATREYLNLRGDGVSKLCLKLRHRQRENKCQQAKT